MHESFQSILGRLSDYGFVNNLVTSTQDGEQQIDELTDDLITEKNKLSKLKANGATDQAIQDQENVVDQLESKISGVNQAVTDYANGETDRKVQDLKEAKQIIKDSKEAYDEAMKSGDTDLAQKLRKNIQDTAKDNMKQLSPAHAGGNVALKHNEQALVNEVGTESIVRNGVWSLLPGGAHLENLKQGDIVFSASQTKDLLEHGRTAGHARAYAEGTASLAHA